MQWRLWCCLGMMLVISGCSNNYAPVSSALTAAAMPGGAHRVSAGETLYTIAWRYDMDYRKLAAINHLSPPYKLLVGQKLRLTAYVTPPPAKQHHRRKKIVTYSRSVHHKTHRLVVVGHWQWPARGKLIENYSPAQGHKGINIAGTMGSPIRAAASGRIAYSGNGLRGYGNLIIIKHNDEYLSAYAHNSKNLVREGQVVKAGQVIALMGNSEAPVVMLHFEIRKAGSSVNPLYYLK